VLPLAVAIPQVFVENYAIPDPLRFKDRPRWFDRLVWTTRLRQGWSMFAPDAPTREMSVVVEAQTEDGRSFDPVYEAAVNDPGPHTGGVPVDAGMDVYWVDFLSHVPHQPVLRTGLQEWLRDYHLRTGRPGDRLVRFAAYHVHRASPPPGQTATIDEKRILIFRGSGAR
jgi:hypothetical protein